MVQYFKVDNSTNTTIYNYACSQLRFVKHFFRKLALTAIIPKKHFHNVNYYSFNQNLTSQNRSDYVYKYLPKIFWARNIETIIGKQAERDKNFHDICGCMCV